MTDPAPDHAEARALAEAEAEADAFAANQRRRKWIGLAVGAVAVAAIAAVVVVKQANKLPGLDADEVRKVREALDSIPAEYRQALAAQAFAELEVGRIPLELREGFEAVAGAPPGMGDMLLLAAIANDEATRATWLLACPDGLQILGEAATVADGTKLVYSKCELGRLGLITESELGGIPLGSLVASHAAWAHLVEHDSEADIERRLLRMMMGRG